MSAVLQEAAFREQVLRDRIPRADQGLYSDTLLPTLPAHLRERAISPWADLRNVSGRELR